MRNRHDTTCLLACMKMVHGVLRVRTSDLVGRTLFELLHSDKAVLSIMHAIETSSSPQELPKSPSALNVPE